MKIERRKNRVSGQKGGKKEAGKKTEGEKAKEERK